MTSRRPLVAVVGNGEATALAEEQAELVGRGIIERGWRLVTGGLGGVMLAASRGARGAPSYREGDVVGVLPGPDAQAANPYVDIAVPTNLGYARNVLVVSMADLVMAVGGGAGTLSELAMAWQLGKPIVALDVPGWSQRLGGQAIDDRERGVVIAASDAEAAVSHAAACLEQRGAG